MANFKLKMKVIVWKNLRIRRNTLISTIFEVLIPVCLIFILALLKHSLKDLQNVYKNETEYFEIRSESNKLKALYFTPNNTQTNRIMDIVRESIASPSGDFRGFETESMMMTYIINLLETGRERSDAAEAIGIVFKNVDDGKLPKSLDYEIRGPSFDVNMLYSRVRPFEAFEFSYYFSSNFLSVQQAVDSAFINLHKTLDFSVSYQMMPSPPHLESLNKDLYKIISSAVPSWFVLSFCLSLFSVTRRILDEKSAGMTELMKMMGLKSWMLWLGWYIHSMLTLFPSLIICAVLLCVPLSQSSTAMFTFSNGFLIWVFLFVYLTSMVSFGFFISTLFNKPSLGASLTIVLWYITFYPAMAEVFKMNSYIFLQNLLLIFPNSCLSCGMDSIFEFEIKGTGLRWGNLFRAPNEYSNFHSVGKLTFLLILEAMMFFFLAWYIGHIKPGEFGIRKPWNFLFKRKVNKTSIGHIDKPESRDEVEAATADLQPGIQIQHLYKKFNHFAAVNDLNLDIYTNQITVLLGHNGAGKTTTMNIVTGMLESTSGTILIDGFNIKTNMDTVRESLGLCPQHNVHNPDLTVIEHLIFFAMLKGLTEEAARIEAANYLSRLGLSSKSNVKAATLSGGMKRRLSLGMALVGPTKTLMLDEPTSGMDPEARREIWDLLLNMRGSRTILITTHYMEEADILGDRIAIMYNGQLKCYGTSLFLKKHYGAGYTLSILVSADWDQKKILTTIQQYIPNAKIKTISVGSAAIDLPTNDTSALTNLFQELETSKTDLGISNFGVSLTTMDDVFLKVGEIADETDRETSKSSVSNSQTYLLDDIFSDSPGKIIKVGLDDLDKYHQSLITAAEFNFTDNKMVLNALYGQYAVHSPAISLNLITNSLLKYVLNDNTASITTGNHPLVFVKELDDIAIGIITGSMLSLGLTLLVCFLMNFHVDERVSGVKHLQIMSGVPRYFYWLSNYVFDLFIYFSVIIIVIILMASFRGNLLYFSALRVLMCLFGFAIFPFTYFFHYRPNVGSLINYLVFFMTVFGMLLPLVMIIISAVLSSESTVKTFHYIFMLFPHYALSDGIVKLGTQSSLINNWEKSNKVINCGQNPPPVCCEPSSVECQDFYNFYTKDNILYNVLYLLLESFLFSALFIFVDYGFLTKYFNKITERVDFKPEELEVDVLEEQKRVTSELNQFDVPLSDAILVSHLRKCFMSFPAVRGLNFGVKQGECFGLLGINGAGKTTTFKMLTGEIFPSSGTANILGNSLSNNKRIYLKQIGYCPQFDALNFQLTPKEMLMIFARLRGVQTNKIQKYVNSSLQKFGIMKYHNVPTEKLSGGNKRKLSTAIALIGDPIIVMLDEPTSGVDPVARRNIWDILATNRKSGQAIVLTSHSMDECEALCDRLAIMVDGQMKCIGNIAYLKNKFGQGFTAMLKLKYVTTVQNIGDTSESNFQVQVADLKSTIESKYDCTLKDEHTGMLLYHITDKSASLGAIFAFMQSLKQAREIVEDFTVSDTSLEQVFLSFAKERVVDKVKTKTSKENII